MNDFAFMNIGASGPWNPTYNDAGEEVQPHWPGQVRNVAMAGGWSEFGRLVGEQVKAKGYKRVWFHNPGGVWPLYPYEDPDGTITHRTNRDNAKRWGYDDRTMWVWQWLIAKSAGVWWADPLELMQAHLTLINDFGVDEVCYYFGGPYMVNYEMQKLCIEDFVRLPKVGLAFDHVVEPYHFYGCHEMFKWIRRENETARIYTEARPYEDVPQVFRKYIDGTVARARFDIGHPRGDQPEIQERARQLGEYIRIQLDGDPVGEDDTGITFARGNVVSFT